MSDAALEFLRYEDGSCVLTDDGEVIWSSDNDEEFLEEFDATIDPEEIDEVIEWLEEQGYIPEDAALDVVDEGD